ncbi:MAG: hypothetical protein ABI369_07320 [Acetobacteraceae bacterium]
MRPMAAPALTRPTFTEHDFIPTKFSTAAEKAWFANTLCRFIAEDCPRSRWTKRLYQRLSLTFGHIAHYDSLGFWAVFFETTAGKVSFIEQTLSWPCLGQPDHAYCDVERLIQARLRTCHTLDTYRALRDADIERRERAALDHLKAKYDGIPPARAADLPTLRPANAATPRRDRNTEAQPTLL